MWGRETAACRSRPARGEGIAQKVARSYSPRACAGLQLETLSFLDFPAQATQ